MGGGNLESAQITAEVRDGNGNLVNIDYKIFIIEQGDDRPFNRGWLLNVGYDIANKQDFNYFRGLFLK